jgi:hypothetical protein
MKLANRLSWFEFAQSDNFKRKIDCTESESKESVVVHLRRGAGSLGAKTFRGS